jgi:holin-like protein
MMPFRLCPFRQQSFVGTVLPNATAIDHLAPDRLIRLGEAAPPNRRRRRAMPFALAILLGCQLLGELLRQSLHLPLPGPLIGMFVLTLALLVGGTGRTQAAAGPPAWLVQTSNGLVAHMGLLFVPAGVGVIAELGLLRRAWLPILAGLVVSTVLGLVVTGLVMHHVTRLVERRPRVVPGPARHQGAQPEAR